MACHAFSAFSLLFISKGYSINNSNFGYSEKQSFEKQIPCASEDNLQLISAECNPGFH